MEKDCIGKKCIVRARNAGVFFGTIQEVERSASGEFFIVKLTNVRRIWRWDGAASLSQLAVDGIADSGRRSCRFTVYVPEMVIGGCSELIPCTDKAIESIESIELWKR